MSESPATETQNVNMNGTASVSASVESLMVAAEIQDATIIDKTEAHLMETNKAQPKFSSADSRKLQDPRDLEIMHLKLMNRALKEQMERLKNKDFVEPILQMGQSSEPFLPSVILTENLNAYKEALQKLDDSFASSHLRYTEGQNIILECSKIINGIESMNFGENSSLIESDLAQYKKKLTDCSKMLTDEQIKITEDKQRMIDAERQFHKILSDYNFLVRDFTTVTLQNKKFKEIIVDRNKQRLQTSFKEVERDYAAKLQYYFESMQLDLGIHKIENKILKLNILNLKKIVDRQKQSHNVEKSTLENEALLHRQMCSELKKELEAIRIDEVDDYDVDNIKAERATLQIKFEELQKKNDYLQIE